MSSAAALEVTQEQLNEESKQLVGDLMGWNPEVIAEKILDFCQFTAGIDFYEYQKEFGWRVIYSMLVNDGEELTALFSRQSGKTETVAVILTGCLILFPVLAQVFDEMEMFKEGLWVGLFAPVLDQAQTTYDRVQMRMRTDTTQEVLRDPDISTRIVGNGLRLDNGSYVRMMSASKQSNIESKTYHLAIVEEAQDVDETKILKSIHPMLAATNGTVVKIGTPNGRKCEFHSAITRNRRKDSSASKRRYRNHFQFDYKVCQKFNHRYKKFIDRERERFGEDGDYFRMAYRLHWMIEIGVFITEETFNACTNPALEVVEADETNIHVFGLDIGKSNDSTVLTILRIDVESVDEQGFYRKEIADWLELHGEDYESQFWQLKEKLDKYRLLRGCVDKTAVGDPIADRLYSQFEEQEIEIDPVTFSTQSKSQMYKYLLQEFNAARLVIPYHPTVRRTRRFVKFQSQILDLEKNWRGQFMVVAHPQVKGAHDDYPDSLALACWAGSEMFFREIEPVKLNPFKDGKHNPLFSRRSERTIFSRRT